MKQLLFLVIFLSILQFTLTAQEKSMEFQPHGKPLALIFTNFNTEFSDGRSQSAFEITRAYLGYEYQLSSAFYAKVILDVGDPKSSTIQTTAFLKNAYIEYSKGKFMASFGMIPTTQFKVSEKIWELRYIEKTFQDAYDFNSSADLGFNLDYQFASFISVDFSVINGEGYKKIQGDEYVRPGIGITLTPVQNITARVFADFMGGNVKQKSLATYLAYTDKFLTLGAEYNYQKNHDMLKGQDIYGTSLYALAKTGENFKLFCRFDDLRSKALAGENSPWHFSNDGQLWMAGLEFNPVKGVKVAPNARFWNRADKALPNSTYAFLNFELKF